MFDLFLFLERVLGLHDFLVSGDVLILVEEDHPADGKAGAYDQEADEDVS